MSISRIFAALSRRNVATHLPYSHIQNIFKLTNKHYISEDSLLHGITRYIVGTADILRGPHNGPVKAFFTDPSKQEIIDTNINPHSDRPLEPVYSPLSSGIVCAEYKTFNDKNEIALTIRKDINHIDQNAVIFALRGIINDDNSFTIKKLMIPRQDKNGGVTAVKSVSLSADNITRALAYAALCAEQIINYEQLTAEENLSTAGLANKKAPLAWDKSSPS